ncbi:synaptotagmin-11 [Schistocerca nitens]|uniref:synaptotagmin-11 n=1 Tax=Schistocerca nitens TaxID=7011 RepID=UPI002119A7CC|nr:synaptotagmin-11 [Schistocerca nitens]
MLKEIDCQECDEEDVHEWMNIDDADPGCQIVQDSEIVNVVTDKDDAASISSVSAPGSEDEMTTPALVGICLGGALFLVAVAAVACSGGLGALSLHQPPRRPTAVRSPAGGAPAPHYLRKSPSPTGNPAKTPPGSGQSAASSPTSGLQTPQQQPGKTLSPDQPQPPQQPQQQQQQQQQPLTPATLPLTEYHTEDETLRDKPSTPSKEELETNEKNLTAGRLGQLVFKIRYKRDKSALIVTVVRCRNLPAKDTSVGSSDPYVKLQLLPDKLHKVKTRVLRKTRDPVYDEDFTFYRVTYNELQSITLHFVVLSFDRYSRDDIIGEVFCPLDSVDLVQAETQQLTLCRDIHPRSLKIRAQGRGEILVSLCWQPAANRLTVVVLKARNLPKMDVTGLADPYVKMYLLYNNQRIAKKKTHVKKRTLNPVFNESFVFDIPAGAEGLDNISLEFLLLDWDRVTKNEVIGRLELGAAKSTGSALHHWNEVCNSPRRQIAEWHKLRE